MLVLASNSPRRRELLAAAGIPCEVIAVQVDEALRASEPPGVYVRRVARLKSDAGLAARPGRVVLGADTVVAVGTEILGKPRDDDEAAGMLRMLSGREHQVLTGVSIVSASRTVVEIARTRVWFNPISEDEIAAYVVSGEPRDKAGAYAIQGLASRFVDRIQGNYTNVVGLPVPLVYRLLKGYPDM
jgi:septum formation protein